MASHLAACILLLGALAAPAWAAAAPARGAAPGQELCLGCHSDPDLTIRTPSGRALSLHVDPQRYRASVHGGMPCATCHRRLVVEGDPGVKPPVLQPVPVVIPTFSPAERACPSCHPDQYRRYRQSIHAALAHRGDTLAPTCQDCHGAHTIRPAADLESSTSRAHVPTTCARCHQQATIMARYDVNTRVVETYAESFHGRKTQLGSERAAVCTSCHGAHDIRAPGDPASRVYPTNRPQTCGQPGCHPGATPLFAVGFTHEAVSRTRRPVSYWIQWSYGAMIIGTIGFMVLYILLDLARRTLRWRQRREGAR